MQNPEYRGLNNTRRGDVKKICEENWGLRGGPPVGQWWGVTCKGRVALIVFFYILSCFVYIYIYIHTYIQRDGLCVCVCVCVCVYIYIYVYVYRGPGCLVGIATGYELDGPWFKSRWGAKFFALCPDRPWRPPSLLYNGYRVFPGSKERPGRDTDPSLPSNALGHERVELYLCSPYGPYGLYRASVPVQ
jgi:hypothetical protein